MNLEVTLERGFVHLLVAKVDGAKVGWLAFHMPDVGEGPVRFGKMFVEPEWRGRGVATAIAAECAELIEDRWDDVDVAVFDGGTFECGGVRGDELTDAGVRLVRGQVPDHLEVVNR